MLGALPGPQRGWMGLEKPFLCCTWKHSLRFEILEPFWDRWSSSHEEETLSHGRREAQSEPMGAEPSPRPHHGQWMGAG